MRKYTIDSFMKPIFNECENTIFELLEIIIALTIADHGFHRVDIVTDETHQKYHLLSYAILDKYIIYMKCQDNFSTHIDDKTLIFVPIVKNLYLNKEDIECTIKVILLKSTIDSSEPFRDVFFDYFKNILIKDKNAISTDKISYASTNITIEQLDDNFIKNL